MKFIIHEGKKGRKKKAAGNRTARKNFSAFSGVKTPNACCGSHSIVIAAGLFFSILLFLGRNYIIMSYICL
jgi:hypothetical protein